MGTVRNDLGFMIQPAISTFTDELDKRTNDLSKRADNIEANIKDNMATKEEIYPQTVISSNFTYGRTQKEFVGIQVNADKVLDKLKLSVFDVYTGGVGMSNVHTLYLTRNTTLELIDKLYSMLGILEDGEIIEGKFYPSNEEDNENGENRDSE